MSVWYIFSFSIHLLHALWWNFKMAKHSRHLLYLENFQTIDTTRSDPSWTLPPNSLKIINATDIGDDRSNVRITLLDIMTYGLAIPRVLILWGFCEKRNFTLPRGFTTTSSSFETISFWSNNRFLLANLVHVLDYIVEGKSTAHQFALSLLLLRKCVFFLVTFNIILILM